MTRHARAILELSFAVVSGICCAATLAWPAWIETVAGIDPDGGSGSLELALASAMALCAVVFAALGRHEWRRATAASA